MKIAMTTLCSKILSQDKEHFAEMAVDAIFRLKVPSLPPFETQLVIPALSLELSCVYLMQEQASLADVMKIGCSHFTLKSFHGDAWFRSLSVILFVSDILVLSFK